MTSARHPAVTVSVQILLWAVCLAGWGWSSLLLVGTVQRWQKCGSVLTDGVGVDLVATSLFSACAALLWYFSVRSFTPPSYSLIQVLFVLSLVAGAASMASLAFFMVFPLSEQLAELRTSCGITTFLTVSRVSIIFLPLLSAALGAAAYAKPHRARPLLIVNGVCLAAVPLLVAIVAP